MSVRDGDKRAVYAVAAAADNGGSQAAGDEVADVGGWVVDGRGLWMLLWLW